MAATSAGAGVVHFLGKSIARLGVFGEDAFERLAGHLNGSPAQELPGAGTPKAHQPVRVQRDDRGVHGAVQDQ